MKRQLTPLAALVVTAGPYLPAIAIGVGALAALAWLFREEAPKSPAVPVANGFA